MTTSPPPAARPAHLGWRLLALVYDTLPNVAIWFALSAIVLLARADHAAFAPWSLGQLSLWALCWVVSGAYAIFSWRRSGTLGMRPWRLRVVAADGLPPPVPALALRYVVATLSLLAVGLGFLWSLVDRERRTWHDLAAGTLLVRLAR